ncbi:MAG: hypothetical protein ACRELB_23600 [Polyangiaceae bacterium]
MDWIELPPYTKPTTIFREYQGKARTLHVRCEDGDYFPLAIDFEVANVIRDQGFPAQGWSGDVEAGRMATVKVSNGGDRPKRVRVT